MTIQDQRVAAAEMLNWYVERTVGHEGPNGELVLDSGRPPGVSNSDPLQPLPNCPEDLNPAFRLVEVLEKEGFRVRMDYDYGWSVKVSRFGKARIKTVRVTESSLPLAITQAALRAKGRWVKE
jgi:hypothetical protein